MADRGRNCVVFIVEGDSDRIALEQPMTALFDICPGKVSLLTVETSKGIEFDCVFVSDIGMGDNERYIAYTRALSRLNIIQKKRWIDRFWQ